MRNDAVFHSSVQVQKATSLKSYKQLINYIKTVGLSKNQQHVFL